MGRPREFDAEAAVAAALPLFIEKGYEGATFAELIAAMRIKPPSFYAAFGNKEGLFRRATALYAQQNAPIVDDALGQPTAFRVLETLLHRSADAHSDPARAGGCLFVQGALACSDKAADIRAELSQRRTAIEPLLEARLAAARANGDTSVSGEPRAVARYVSTLLGGMAVQAVGGATRADLHDVAATALAGLA